MRRILLAAALLASVALCLPASAQTPRRISGTVDSVDGDRIAVRLHNGQSVIVTMSADTRFGALANRALSDIRAGDYVGSAAMPGTDGKLHAQEVHIFPEAMRGASEGHKPMEEPGQTMTNATVSEVAADPAGHELFLKYPGGQQVIEVAPNTRIVELIPGDRSLLKPGVAIMAITHQGTDGSFPAQFIQAEKDGVKPLS